MVLAQLLFKHAVSPPAQLATHAPTEQKGVGAAHACPQVPQFIASDMVLAHALPHDVSGAMQVQRLPAQT